MKAMISSLLIAATSAFELFKVDHELLKGGLHRDLVTNATFRIDSQEELDKCSLIFKQTLPKDAYIYQEEIKAVKGLQFWPGYTIDIEKPASFSKDYEIIWRLRFQDAV
jgi:hypothetical protein